jgi:acetyl esterase/lipase
MSRPLALALILVATWLAVPAQAESLRERIQSRLAERQAQSADQNTDQSADERTETRDGLFAVVPAGVRVLRDVAYGNDAKQTMDVYLPSQRLDTPNTPAPVVFMVHGGGWRRGDKQHGNVVTHKLARWAPKGIVFISVNYPMIPEADPLVQAGHVAKALAYAQHHAAEWGADPARFILMGHSAGAHLVALLTADPARATAQGAQPWLGTVALDSAAMNVATLMQARHLPLYDKAFGSDADFWRHASPTLVLKPNARPLLAVCSSRRAEACPQANRYVDAAQRLGVTAAALPQDKSHSEINDQLGLPGAYTDSVEQFMGGLDARVAAALKAAH